jgi:hypothetical protein
MCCRRVDIRIGSLSREVHVIDAQFIVKPMSLCFDKLWRKEALGLNLVHYPAFKSVTCFHRNRIVVCLLLHLLSLALELGGFIAGALLAQDAGVIRGARHAQMCGLGRGQSVGGSDDMLERLVEWHAIADGVSVGGGVCHDVVMEHLDEERWMSRGKSRRACDAAL